MSLTKRQRLRLKHLAGNPDAVLFDKAKPFIGGFSGDRAYATHVLSVATARALIPHLKQFGNGLFKHPSHFEEV